MPKTQSSASLPEKVDLTNCDREPIHFLGRVQDFGCLVAVSSDWIVTHASENIRDYFGHSAEAMRGMPIREFLDGEALHNIRSRIQMLTGDDIIERIFGIAPVPDSDRLFDAAVHRSGANIVIEFEPHDAPVRGDYAAFVRPMIDRLSRCRSVRALCQMATRQIKAMTGFDRVMVYRFHQDDSGEVIAESHGAGAEPFLGLRYPASDIPAQARTLYLRNKLRIISDVSQEGVPIVPVRGPDGRPLDLSLSGLRAVSPIHLEYLRNMGVGASMSISIIRRGKLWGLFACHHSGPRVLNYELRSAAELFGQLFAYVLDQLESDIEREETVEVRRLHDRLMVQLAEDSSVADNFDLIADALGSLIPCDGIAGWVDGSFVSRGCTPTHEEFLALARFLNTTEPSQVYTTDRLAQAFPPAASFSERAAGLLAVPVSRTPRDYIVLFRREIAQTVRWAGNPEKPVEVGANGIRLTPRKSFEAWQEVVRGQSLPWTESQKNAAEALRVTMLEVVLRMSEAANRDRAKAREQQELLIAELNHRVRNILNLIKGLVAQSRSEVRSVSQFTEVVGGRIHALARAHDQLTQQNWAAGSIRTLIETEVAAYLGGQSNRIVIEGPDAELAPTAFTALALVIHELTTNSAKYGALTDQRGRILIDLEPQHDDAIVLHWQEVGGPPVQAPTRRGFGTTVIERSVPFDLKGEAEVSYEVTGLRARFLIPGRHIHGIAERKDPSLVGGRSSSGKDQAMDGGIALIVEDNMIIALDAEDALTDLGAEEVLTASSVEDAMRFLDENTVLCALLDVNLGEETSEAVAERLTKQSIPFVFATGYGDALSLTDRYPHAPVVQKPYDKAALAEALQKVLDASGEAG